MVNARTHSCDFLLELFYCVHVTSASLASLSDRRGCFNLSPTPARPHCSNFVIKELFHMHAIGYVYARTLTTGDHYSDRPCRRLPGIQGAQLISATGSRATSRQKRIPAAAQRQPFLEKWLTELSFHYTPQLPPYATPAPWHSSARESRPEACPNYASRQLSLQLLSLLLSLCHEGNAEEPVSGDAQH